MFENEPHSIEIELEALNLESLSGQKAIGYFDALLDDLVDSSLLASIQIYLLQLLSLLF
jgi:hypothetical protein